MSFPTDLIFSSQRQFKRRQMVFYDNMTTFFEKYLSFNKKKVSREKRPVYFRIAWTKKKSLYTLSTENVPFGQMLWSQDIFLTFSDELKILVLWFRKGTSTSGRVFKIFLK
jgi:hypothetical protein